MQAGIVLGRSYLGRNPAFADRVFPLGGRLVLETIADVGFIFHLLIVGIHVDVEMVKKVGKDAIAVGLASFMTPFTIGIVSTLILSRFVPTPDISLYSLLFLVTVNSMTSFAGTTGHLSDLQILNSDMGRIATLASMVNDCCNYILYISISAITTFAKEKRWSVLWSLVWSAALCGFLACIVRPKLAEIARSKPEGQNFKEGHFLGIIIMALICAFLTESIGMPAGFGTFLFGATVPDGPPLGTSVVPRLDAFCTGLLLPAKFAIAAFTVNIFSFQGRTPEVLVAFIIILGYLGKFMGVLISGLVFQIPFWDSLSLSLIMCCRGVVEISIFITLKESGVCSLFCASVFLSIQNKLSFIAQFLRSKLYESNRSSYVLFIFR